MKPLLLLFISSIIFLSGIAQSDNIEKWDKDLNSKIKGKLKSIMIGNRAIGSKIWYYKSNRSIFSIVKRSQHGRDSVSSVCFNFQNDTLFRAVVTRAARGGTSGSAIVYLEGNKLIEQKVKGVIFTPSIPVLKDSSNKMLDDAKQQLSWRLK